MKNYFFSKVTDLIFCDSLTSDVHAKVEEALLVATKHRNAQDLGDFLRAFCRTVFSILKLD